MQTYTVPDCAQDVVIITYGAQGADGSTINPSINSGGQAGLGNRVVGEWTNLLPGQMIYVNVGGAAQGGTGGYNGGGNGIAISGQNPSGGGGGATDVRFPSADLSDRVQVAGGGGGGGNAAYHWNGTVFTGGDGGNGGGSGSSLDGANGANSEGDLNTFPGGLGGTSAGPGAGAVGCGGFLGQAGEANNGEVGGNGGIGSSLEGPDYRANGGAGGGGYVGGNGGGGGSAGTPGCSGNMIGAGGGGSAGTNYFNGEPDDFENGVRQGNGLVVIQYIIVSEEAELSLATTPCVGEEVNFTFSPEGGTFFVLQGNSADVSSNGVFSPSTTGTYQVRYEYTDDCTNITTADTVTVSVTCDLAGLADFENNFKVYPNPTEDVLYVQASAVLGNIVISDASGQVVMTTESSSNLMEIDVRRLDAGIYFLQTTNGIHRFIVK